MNKLLVVVDYQNDFVNGALGFEGAADLEHGIVQAVEACLAAGGKVLFTRDTHDENYLNTREGKHLPLPHCIAGQAGHHLYGRLHKYEETLPPSTLIVNKPTFGCEEIGKHAITLCGGEPDIVQLCGLVTDICVVSNAILLHTALPSAKIQVIKSLCGSANSANAISAFAILQGLGIELI